MPEKGQTWSKVEYSLTEIGQEFRPVIHALGDWGDKYIEQMAG